MTGKRYEWRGESLTINQIGLRLGVNHNTIKTRLQRGIPLDKLANRGRSYKLYEYQGRQYTLRNLAAHTGVRYSLLAHRLSSGMSVQEAVDKPYHSQCAGRSDFDNIPYSLDGRIQKIVEENPDGLDNQQIGLILGISRERVRQILESALAKLRANRSMQIASVKAEPVTYLYEARRFTRACPNGGE